jgi:hypothetical protein
MVHVKYPKGRLVLGLLLLLGTILINTAEDGQRTALAQITPAPEKAGSNDDSSSITSPNTNGDNANNGDSDGNTGSSSGSSDNDGGDDSSDNGDSSDNDDSQITPSSDEQDDETSDEDF